MDQYSHEHLTNFLPSLYDDTLHLKSVYDGLSGSPPYPNAMDIEPMSPNHSPLSFRSLSPGPSPTIAPDSTQVAADMSPLFGDISYFKDHYFDYTIHQPRSRSPCPYTDPMPPIKFATNCDDYSFGGANFVPYSPMTHHPIDLASGSSSPPLTVSPQLLHSPSPVHHSDSHGSPSETHYEYDSDMDAEGETDDEDEDDGDEYTGSSAPPPPRRSTRKTRSAATSSNHFTSRPSRTTRPSASSSRQPSTEVYEAVADPSLLIRAPGRRAEGRGTPNYESTNANGDFVCETCGHVCKASRKVDFKRHVNTHYPCRVSGAVVCCGVPVEMRNQGPWRGLIPSNAPIKTFYGRHMVGGCGRIFSRTDALQRHIELNTNSCVGSVKGDWHPPKQRE